MSLRTDKENIGGSSYMSKSRLLSKDAKATQAAATMNYKTAGKDH